MVLLVVLLYVSSKNVAKDVARAKNCNAYPIRAVAFPKLGIIPVSAATPNSKNNSSNARRAVTRSVVIDVVVVFRVVVVLVLLVVVVIRVSSSVFSSVVVMLLVVVVLASRSVALTSSRMAAIARGNQCNHAF